jgi:hypothetical protein
MGGQKRFGKRSIEGSVTINGINLIWQLVSEPQVIAGEGLRGLRISVQAEGGHNRELILEYPFPDKRNSVGLAQVPQRPKFSPKIVEADIRQALAAGWDPASRGKTLISQVPEFPN